jgi:glycosyltransferase involved in cell wall biosynthesis
MKIVFLVNKYPPSKCGVGDYSFHLARTFVQYGHEVHIVCRADQQPAKEPGNTHLFTWPLVEKWTPKGFSGALQKIKDIQPDWVLLQYVPYSFHEKGLPVLLPAILRSIKSLNIHLLIFFHEAFIRMVNYPLHLYVAGRLQRWIAKRICDLCDIIMTSIDLYKKFLQSYTTKEIAVVPVGSNIMPVDADDILLKELRKKVASNDQQIIVTFGERYHQQLVAVFKELQKRGNSFKLLICGNVKDVNVYKDISKDVYITGFLPATDIFRFLKIGDVFFLPDGDDKGRGGTALKSGALAAALAAGLPVVGIKGDANDKLLLSAETVRLADGHDVNEICNYILNFLKEANYKNNNFWNRELRWDVIAENYLLLMQAR